MIVHDFDLIRAVAVPLKTQPPLVIDANAVLPFAVAFQGLKLVAGRHPQTGQGANQNSINLPYQPAIDNCGQTVFSCRSQRHTSLTLHQCHKKMNLISWNRKISRNLAVVPEIIGSRHNFIFEDSTVTLSLPKATEVKEDLQFARVTVDERSGPNGDPIKYNVHQLDLTVDLNSELDLLDDVLLRPIIAYDIIPATLQRELDVLTKKHEEIAESAYEYWLAIMRWVTDDYKIGRASISNNQSGWGTRLKEPLSNRFVWESKKTYSHTSMPAVTVAQWNAAAARLGTGEATPIYMTLRHDALEFARHGDYRRAIMDLAVSCETFLRHRVLNALPPDLEKQVSIYVELANINQYVSKFFPATLAADDVAAYKNLKSELESLFSKRNDIAHRGISNGATEANCNRFARILKELFGLGDNKPLIILQP